MSIFRSCFSAFMLGLLLAVSAAQADPQAQTQTLARAVALRNDGRSYGYYVEQLTYPPARNGRGIGSRSCW